MSATHDTQNRSQHHDLRYGSLIVDPVAYEIIWLGRNQTRLMSAFPDIHTIDRPVWRLVSGYLMLSSTSPAPTPGQLGVFSHGHHIADLTESADGAVLLRFDTPPQVDAQGVSSSAGLAIITDTGTTFSLGSDARTVIVMSSASDRLGFTFVHGPAAGKVENRVRLLRSLRHLKGDHG